MGKNKPKQKAAAAKFDEAALAQLTSKIDQTLSKTGDTGRKSNKRKRQDAPSNAPKPKKRQVADTTNDESKDKKHSAKPKSAGKKGNKPSGKLSRDDFLKEIRLLGGDEEDFELIKDVDSDAEEGSGKKLNSAAEVSLGDDFKNELAKFASSLGFQDISMTQDAETDESDGEGEEEDGDEEAHEEEGSDEHWESDDAQAQEEEEVVKPPQPTKGKMGKLIFEPRSDWYGLDQEGLPTAVPDNIKPYSSAIASLKAYAQSLLDGDTALFSAGQKSSSNQKFMSTIMSSGTLSDKVSALTLAVQESPVHNVKAFESLITLAGKKSRGQAIAALAALVDLLNEGSMLPSNRRLRQFASQPGILGSLHKHSLTSWNSSQKLPGKLTKAQLIMFLFEDWLKDAYFRIIQLLEVWCNDEIEYSRMRALAFVFGLLKDKPEQEANLLRLLVSKLGDRDRKIASRASYLLLQLLNVHPGMKAIVINSVEQEILLRPGQGFRAKYYAINTLNQTILSGKEPAIADNLVRIYFDLFMSLLKTGSLASLDNFDAPSKDDQKETKGRPGGKKPKQPAPEANEDDSAQKLVSAVLTGVNRAIPFTTADDPTLEKYLDTLYKITHSSNFNTSIQALMLIQQLANRKHIAVERYYRTLYESLLDPRLVVSSKQALYLNLLYRSLKNDVDVRRVKAFVKRMLQVVNLHQPSFACGILFMIAELQGTFPDLKSLLTDPEDNDDGEEVFKDVVEDDDQAPQIAVSQSATAPNTRRSTYDGRKRDPEYSNADKSCLWELAPFFSHFHPSVKVFAANILERQKSLPKPELANHTLMHFLDKFVYRNPKTTEAKHGGSIMQPVMAAGSAAQVVVPGKAAASQQPVVNSSAFWNLKPEQVAAEDVFFHEYYAKMDKAGQAARAAEKVKKHKKDGVAEEGEEEDEDEIWDALVNSKPDIEGDFEDESDVDMEGYDDDSDDDLDLEDGGAAVDEDSDGSGGFEGIFDDSDEEEDMGESDAEVEAEGDEDAPVSKWKERRQKKKEMKALPTFASAEDYAEMLGADEDGLDD